MKSNDIVQMFTDRKPLVWGPTSGSAWAQRNGNEASSFWVTKKQADWVIGQYMREHNIPVNVNQAEGSIIVDGTEVKWCLTQMSKKSNNGAGSVALAR